MDRYFYSKLYHLFAVESDGQFAYSVTIEKDNGITTGGVERLNDNGEMINDKAREEWYTIDGRKINGKPTKKGVYVKNGRKVIL